MEALQRLHNRGSISTGFDIDNSCMFDWNGTNTANNSQSYMYDSTWTGTPTSTTTGCFSTWFKNSLSDSTCSEGVASFVNNYSSGNDRSYIMGDWGGTGNFVFGQKVSGAWNFRVVSNNFHRDPSAWYHFFAVWDTSNSTESERIRLYVNGERITSLSAAVYPSQNQECYIVSKEDFSIGRAFSSIYGNFTHGYMAETHFVDGTAYAPTTFGEFDEDSGIWKPKQVSVSYGNKGFYFDYKDASNLGNDVSGNNRDLTLSDIDSTHQATDTPTNNFCTLNPLIYDINSGDDEAYVLRNGATTITSSKNAYAQNYATIGLNIAKGGKWYFEWTATSHANGSSSEGLCGLSFDTQWNSGLNSTGVYNAGYAFYAAGFGHGEGYSTNVVNGLLIDLDNNKVKWYRNGTLHVTMPDDGGGSTMQTTGYAFPYIAPYGSGYTINVNFGGYTAQTISSGNTDPDGYGNFEYATQGGYAICTKNLEEYG
jgi:hypothetical protein